MPAAFQHIQATAEQLVKQENHSLAFQLLDHYWPRSKTLEDYELLGTLALKIGHTKLAVCCAETVYGLSKTPTELYIARVNLNKAYYRDNQPEKALFYNKLNLDIRPDDFDSVVSYAAALKLNNQRADSEALIEELKGKSWVTDVQRENLKITATHPLLRAGQTAEGIHWFLHNDRDRTTVFDLRGMRMWNGVITPGETLYVNACGGAGDEFINIRFFHRLKELGMRPRLFSILNRPDLAKIFRRNGFDVFVSEEEIVKKHPWTYLMNLPIDLGVTERHLWQGAYIKPLRQQRNQLPPTEKFRVGIKCTGNPYFEQDIYRSIPIEQMLAHVPPEAEIYYFDLDNTHPGCHNLRDKIRDWDDTLDLLSQMDIVLSSCTSIIHAAGSMGIPSIVCVPILEYYIWTSSRTDETTPWYGSNMWVLKQQKVKCWAAPLKRAEQIIREHMENKSRQNHDS